MNQTERTEKKTHTNKKFLLTQPPVTTPNSLLQSINVVWAMCAHRRTHRHSSRCRINGCIFSCLRSMSSRCRRLRDNGGTMMVVGCLHCLRAMPCQIYAAFSGQCERREKDGARERSGEDVC